MSPSFVREVLRVAPLLGRLRTVRLSGIMSGIAAFGFALTLSVVSALTLSPEQTAQSDLGSYDSVLQLSGAYSLDQSPDSASILTAIALDGGRNARVALTAHDIRFREFPESRRTFFLEMNWDENLLRHNYTLLSGRFPAQPGEAAISEEIHAIARTQQLTGFGGDVSVRVVGVVRDEYQQDGTFILAAPGTWASWGIIPQLAERYPSVMGNARVYWSGTAQPVQLTQWQVRSGSLSAEEATASLASTLMTRALLMEHSPSLWLGRFPLLLAFPLLAVPLLTALLAGGLNGRWMRRMQTQWELLGISTSLAASALWVTTMAATITAIAAGWAAGAALGWASRPLIDAVVNHPLGPHRWLLGEALLVVVGSLVGMALTVVSLPRAFRGLRLPSPSPTTLRWWRQGLAAGCSITFVALALIKHDPSTASSMVIIATLAMCLWLPDILMALLQREPLSIGSLTAVRSLRGRHVQTMTAVMALAAVLALALSATAIAYSLEETLRRKAIDRLPPAMGQLIAQHGQEAVPELIRSRLEGDVGLRDPISSFVLKDVLLESSGTSHAIALFDDVDSIARWNADHPLTESQRAILSRGGVLLTEEGTSAVLVTEAQSVHVDAGQLNLTPEWAQQFGGVMLRSTIQARGWGTIDHTFTYTHLTPDQEERLRTSAERTGIDPNYVVYGYPADVQTLPEKYSAALGLLTLLDCIIVAAFTAAQGRALRPQLASLAALGIPRRWLARVLAHQVLWVVGAGVAAATIIAVVGLATIFLVDRDYFDPVFPWPSLALIVAVTLGGTVIGLAAGMTQLRPAERRMN